ncbi:MAG: Stage V sporulation protein K [Firmicutes bacterium ADurb.Bin080]|nr:MAG: Stage V sporulation protein K [Firmicutes bacterium ADurb.Bin080]
MRITAEEFEEKLKEREFSSCNPKLLKNLLTEHEIVDYINNSNFSIQCKNQLIQFFKTINKLQNEGKHIEKSLLLMGDENLSQIKFVVQSILVEAEVSNNILYCDDDRRNPYELSSLPVNGIIEVGINPRDFSIKYSEYFFENYSDNFIIYKGTRDDILLFLDMSKIVFPFTIDDNFSREEKLKQAKKICLEYGFVFINDKPDHNLDSITLFGLRKQLYSLMSNALMEEKEDKSINLSEIIALYVNRLKNHRRSLDDDFEEDSGPEIPHEDISMDDLIGLAQVKKQVKRLCNFFSQKKDFIPSKHMFFTGNPGTGKTTVARCLQQLFYKNGVIKKNVFIETDKGGLCGKYVGHTAIKTKKIFEKALGGVLFIDEAYALTQNTDDRKIDFGHEAISTLLKLMEDNRDNTVVIMAGYSDEMKTMVSANPGLKSRVQFSIDFPNYNPEELLEITEQIFSNHSYTLNPEAKTRIQAILEKATKEKDFSNGRFARNLCEQLMLIQAERTNDSIIMPEDVETYLAELPKEIEKPIIGFSAI